MAQHAYRINAFSAAPGSDPGAALQGLDRLADPVDTLRFGDFHLAVATVEGLPDPTGEALDRTLGEAVADSGTAYGWRAALEGDRSYRAVALGRDLDGARLGEVAEALNGQGLVITGLRTLSESFAAVELTVAGPAAEPHQLTRALRPAAEEAGVDLAVLPPRKEEAVPGLLMMDMDSTLLAVECIDEIAEHAGVKEQVAAITERAMNGELDFKGSLVERVKMLEGLPEDVLESVYRERIVANPGARRLVEAARGMGVRVAVVSGGFTFFTDRLKDELQLDFTDANVLEVSEGQLTGRVLGDIVDGERKAANLRALRDRLGLARDQLIVMGDGANDLPMIAEAGLGLAFHAKPKVRERAPYNLIHSSLDGALYLLGLTDAQIDGLLQPAET
ncbi:phosphoserine phosphatase SerB [Thiohalorhabdus denitrificans]|uniref:Phosphoserine phosphatase n=1 Tax=Thiohalorhabdus denitrificans TaxID=381306 RepID=A0A1G5DHH1_9GAMM|nr:phosphoserine phosphatase SerB [Thiohalorhabdus denitrificans]SCY13820.1 phosphoserine phosphatase [Thiohalorhabdus denitrificans]